MQIQRNSPLKITPQTPQQNGFAERKIRSLLNLARSMLNATNLEPKFWEEAVATTCYIQSRIYHCLIGLHTLFEMWYRHSPHLQDLKIFGCIAFACVLENKRNKLNARAQKPSLLDKEMHTVTRPTDPTTHLPTNISSTKSLSSTNLTS